MFSDYKSNDEKLIFSSVLYLEEAILYSPFSNSIFISSCIVLYWDSSSDVTHPHQKKKIIIALTFLLYFPSYITLEHIMTGFISPSSSCIHTCMNIKFSFFFLVLRKIDCHNSLFYQSFVPANSFTEYLKLVTSSVLCPFSQFSNKLAAFFMHSQSPYSEIQRPLFCFA